jgi:hypothetical protein
MHTSTGLNGVFPTDSMVCFQQNQWCQACTEAGTTPVHPRQLHTFQNFTIQQTKLRKS